MPNQPPLSSAEVCDLLAINRSTLSRWVRDGRLTPTHRVGKKGAFLFAAADIQQIAKAA